MFHVFYLSKCLRCLKYVIECPIGDKYDDVILMIWYLTLLACLVSQLKKSRFFLDMGPGLQGKLLLDDEGDICQRGKVGR